MTIVAAVDNSEYAPQIAKEGENLARAFGEDLHVVHILSQSRAIDLERTNIKESGKPIGSDRIEVAAAEIAEEAAEDLSIDFESVGIRGDPIDEITHYSDQQDARYVVLGGRKRSPLGKAFFGSVSQSVLLNSGCPVVTVIRD